MAHKAKQCAWLRKCWGLHQRRTVFFTLGSRAKVAKVAGCTKGWPSHNLPMAMWRPMCLPVTLLYTCSSL